MFHVSSMTIYAYAYEDITESCLQWTFRDQTWVPAHPGRPWVVSFAHHSSGPGDGQVVA